MTLPKMPHGWSIWVVLVFVVIVVVAIGRVQNGDLFRPYHDCVRIVP